MHLTVWFKEREYNVKVDYDSDDAENPPDDDRIDFTVEEVMDVATGLYEVNSDIIEDDEFLDAIDEELRAKLVAGDDEEEDE